MIEISPIFFSMAEESYTERLWTMVRSLELEMADDAVGVGEWKKCRNKACSVKANTVDIHGAGEFPSDSGSPLSTFSSTPKTPSSFNMDSPRTPTFLELWGTNSSDDTSPTGEQVVRNLIGEISDSPDSILGLMMAIASTLANPNLNSNVNKENIDPNTNSVTVVIETVAETSKEVKRIANKGSRDMISENDLNERDQKRIHTDYIKKGKDLSKLKEYLKEQKEKALKKTDYFQNGEKKESANQKGKGTRGLEKSSRQRWKDLKTNTK